MRDKEKKWNKVGKVGPSLSVFTLNVKDLTVYAVYKKFTLDAKKQNG